MRRREKKLIKILLLVLLALGLVAAKAPPKAKEPREKPQVTYQTGKFGQGPVVKVTTLPDGKVVIQPLKPKAQRKTKEGERK